MLFDLCLAVIAQIKTLKESDGKTQKYKTVSVWNDQVRHLRGKGDEVVIESPSAFIEFQNVVPEQLGNGFQIFNPLKVIIHIVQYQEDAGDGTMDRNSTIYSLADEMYKLMQMFKPTGAGSFIRTNETPEFNHDNVYHWTQEYTTNYIDSGAQPPKGGQDSPAPLALDLTVNENVTDEPE